MQIMRHMRKFLHGVITIGMNGIILYRAVI